MIILSSSYVSILAIGAICMLTRFSFASIPMEKVEYDDMADPTEKTDEVAGQTDKTDLILEFLVGIDYSIYKQWLDFNNGDDEKAVSDIKFRYTHIVNNVFAKFQAINESAYRFTGFRITGFYIAKTAEEAPFTLNPNARVNENTISINVALGNYMNWVAQHVKNGQNSADRFLPKSDIALLFVSLMTRNGVGMAFVAAACTKWSAAVFRDDMSTNVYQFAAHEIGHNLGSTHDGNNNECKGSDHFIMEAYWSPGLYNHYKSFSSCSVAAFDKYINKLQRSKNNCLLSTSLSEEFVDTSTDLAVPQGVRFNATIQCRFRYGEKSYACNDSPATVENFCRVLICYIPSKAKCSRTPGDLRAIEGTVCGIDKQCKDYNCV